MDKDLAILKTQQLPNGLTIAGGGDYDKIWIRDNVYVALAFMEAGLTTEAAKIYRNLLAIIRQYEHILDLEKYPEVETELLHPRFTISGDEVPGQWGNKQHDAVGALLFGIGQVFAKDAELVSPADQKLCQKLVRYLENCRYWEDKDDGMWEEHPMLHASSLAACIRGIKMVGGFCTYNKNNHEIAEENLEKLLPRESSAHRDDMALLTLLWPYGYQRRDILENIESNLLRDKGIVRFQGDIYEAKDSKEPQWVMGIPWLGIAHYELGDMKKAAEYLQKTEDLYTDSGLPESYLAANEACVHTPLAWSHAMALVLRVKLGQQKSS